MREIPFLQKSDSAVKRYEGSDKQKSKGDLFGESEDDSSYMMFQSEIKRQGTDSDEEDEDFENGDNKKEGTELEIIDTNQLENMVQDAYANFNEQFNHMSIKQKTNYFVISLIHNYVQIINTVLMSICHCLISGYEKEIEDGKGFIKGLNIGVIKKAIRYQL